MSLAIRSAFPKSVFELMGKDENSATYALGWALERSPALASLLAARIASRHVQASDIRIELQASGEDRGFTDVEIRCGSDLHAILEAKQGFEIPSVAQLKRYRPRLDVEPARTRSLISVSALPESIAMRRLPSELNGVPVRHISWGALRGLAKKARQQASSQEEKLWLRELIEHLEDYAAMSRARDNMVYVVSLGSGSMRQGSTHTWIDVVEKDGRYFHPVGNTWPTQPPNYMGFRYRGKLHSVHRVESFDIVTDVSSVNPLWCSTNQDHFVYKLGPAMRPAKELRAGGPQDSIQRSARVWCAIDTLISGQFDQLGQARDETKRRLDLANDSDS